MIARLIRATALVDKPDGQGGKWRDDVDIISFLDKGGVTHAICYYRQKLYEFPLSELERVRA